MRLISLSLRQWRTFERCDIEFPDGLIGIRGPNGAGKTTLAEAIGWALFGKVRPGGRIDDLRRQDAPKGETSSVELVFRIGPTLYRVERVVRGAAKLWIGDSTTPETTQTRTTNSRIALELDMNWDVFHRTVFARQKDVAALDPAGSADARRRHVERLLGLERYRLAAEKARADARSIGDELTGRLAEAPDIAALEAEVAAAEQQAADDDPNVERAATTAEDLRKHLDELVRAVDDEADRARKNVELEAERKRQAEVAEQAEGEATRLETVIFGRATQATRLEEIGTDAATAPEAARKAELWNELAERTAELAAAESELAAIGYDSTAEQETQSRAADLRAEQAAYLEEQAILISLTASLGRRLAALEAVINAEPVEAARHALGEARSDQQGTRESLGIERHALGDDETHFAAVAEGGGDTPCPVCLRPYGAEYETILEKYRSRIEEHKRAIVAFEQRDTELVALLRKREEAVRAAEQAAENLAETEGPDEAPDAQSELARAEAGLGALSSRLAEIEEQLGSLELAAGRHTDAREKWRAQEAIRSDRAGRVARILEALNVDEYDAQTHAAITNEATRLSALAAEVERLSHDLASSEGAEAQKSAADLRTHDARLAEVAAAAELSELAYDLERLPALKEERDAAQKAHTEAATALAEARAAAQARSAAVRSLRERLEEGRRVREAIEQRTLELERHKVAADLLTEFRGYQSQRAWPHLEQGASAILSAATDGRYADVSLSDDFRIVVMDRGERHELSRFSGGEQDVTNLCLRLAIAEWVAQERGAEINFVVLDEVFGSQDDERRQLLLGELRALGNRFQQLLVITHLADIADLCEHQIDVRLEEPGRSTASVEA